MSLVQDARAEGVRVTADQYPWLASGTRLSNALVPRWAQAGGQAVFAQRLADPEVRARIIAAMQNNLRRRGGPDKLLLTGAHDLRGLTLEQAALRLEQDVLEAALTIILDGDPAIASFMMDRNDVLLIGQQPWVVTGSDGSTGHPRKFATFPKKYQDFVGEHMTLSQFVARSSGNTARILNFCDRGLVRVGKVADIAVWDPDRFVAVASYEDPQALAQGMVHVWVQGQWALKDGSVTTQRAGRVLKRQACRVD